MLLVLQRRGRLTARELSTELEVSERTVLRDVEALSEAGVPIYATRGAGGGIELMAGFVTRLTGLTPQEAECLFLIGQAQVAHRLGLGAPTRSARHKLGTAMSPALAEKADSLSSWFLHDPDPWGGQPMPHGELRRIAGSVRRRRRMELYLAERPPMTVEPLGLVLKAGRWHLVVGGDGTPAVVPLDELRATRLTTQHFEAPSGFSLTDFWTAHLAAGRPDPDPAGR
jgi:predicted DNA-binding transcriptional regulator YafY